MGFFISDNTKKDNKTKQTKLKVFGIKDPLFIEEEEDEEEDEEEESVCPQCHQFHYNPQCQYCNENRYLPKEEE